ncbi:GNAT family N-acetyltransferase [Geminicoccaceae bacterium 1502E]|nr:GNAT family N-acetyltransferase [Geminicoccaceae bacterium 1502E]
MHATVHRHTEILAAHLPLEDAARILEVGCGDGSLVAWMRRRGAQAVGLEPDPGQLRRAAASAPGAVLAGRGEALPLADAALDAVLFFNSLHHVPTALQRAALAEAARALRPGGRLVVIEPLAEGDYFELLRPVEDETAIRAAAWEALRGVDPGLLGRQVEERYDSAVTRASAGEVCAAFLAADPARADALAAGREALARQFERLGEPVEGGRRFIQPMRLDVLRRPAAVAVREARDAGDREAAFAIRRAVFVDEQKVPLADEFDAHDATCRHLLALAGGRPAGTLRWRAHGPATKIERVAVLQSARGRGVGAAMMRHLLARLDEERVGESVLHAQTHATRFYGRLGFVAEGREFEEDGILHVRMRRRLPGGG